MKIYLSIIIAALVGEYLIRCLTRYFNLKAMVPDLPAEFDGFYDQEQYRKSQQYTRVNTKFSYVSSSISLIVMLVFILMGGFNVLDIFVRSLELSPIPTGLIFFAILFLVSDWLSLPFSLYNTFVIEERFGFNKTTIRTFILDKFKTYFLSAVLGFVIMGSILYFFDKAAELAWLYAWMLVSIFIVAAPPIFTAFISPLFNKFTPLPEGELKDAIHQYAQKVSFPLTDLFIMDGSKRSSHSNAYFSGFGRKKRIVLFDTLIEQHSVDELVAIIAHEVGHYKKKHIFKGMMISILHTGLLFYLLSIFIDNRSLFQAFGMDEVDHVRIYAGFVFFGVLYSPIEFVLSVAMHYLSRKHEYQADAYAVETLGLADSLILGLKKLSVANLGNLTPHPVNVFLNYSHPPVLERISAMRDILIVER